MLRHRTPADVAARSTAGTAGYGALRHLWLGLPRMRSPASGCGGQAVCSAGVDASEVFDFPLASGCGGQAVCGTRAVLL